MAERWSHISGLTVDFDTEAVPLSLKGGFTELESGVELPSVGGKASKIDLSRFFESKKLGWGYPSVIDLTDKCDQKWETNKDGARSLVIEFKDGERLHLSGLPENEGWLPIHDPLEDTYAYCQLLEGRASECENASSPAEIARAIENVHGGGLAVKTLRINMKEREEPQPTLTQEAALGPESTQTNDIEYVTFVAEYVKSAPTSSTEHTTDDRV